MVEQKYIDTLMRDLGLNPYRKKTLVEEWFTPYRPRDYRGLVEEYLASNRLRRGQEEKSNSDTKTGEVNGFAKGNPKGYANGTAAKCHGFTI